MLAWPRVQAGVPARPGTTSRPRVRAGVPARPGTTSRPRVAAGSRITACPRGISPARRAAQPRVTIPARVATEARVTGQAGISVPAQVTVPAGVAAAQARITIKARITSQARITIKARVTSQARATAVQAVHARLPGTALHRTLPPRPLIHGPLIHAPPIYGPPTHGTVPPARTRTPASLTAVVPGGILARIIVRVAGASTVRVEAGVTSGNRPTPARVPGRLRTAVAHAPLTNLRPAAVTVPKSLHHEAPAQAPLPGRRGRCHPLRSVSPSVLDVPATATRRPRGFAEREPAGEAAPSRTRKP